MPFSYLSGTVQFTEWHMYSFILCLHETFYNLFRPTSNIQGSFGLLCFHAWTDAVLKTLVLWNHHVSAYILVHPDWPCGMTAQLSAILIVTPFFCDGVKLSKLENALFLKTLQDVLSFSLKRYRMSWVYPNEGTCLSSGLASLGYGCGLNQLISPILWRRSSQSQRSRSAFVLHNLWCEWTAHGIRK